MPDGGPYSPRVPDRGRPRFSPLSGTLGEAGADGAGSAAAPVARGSLSLFLALYLLLLAFFIMLNALSTLETRRASAVMDSLTTTFRAGPGAASTQGGPQAPNTVPGPGRAAEAFTAVIQDLFEGTIPSARVQQLLPGVALTLVVRTDSLFATGAARIRPAHVDLLDGIVAALAQAPAGARFELTALIQTEGGAVGLDQAEARPLPVGSEALAFRRATELARQMGARGAEPGTVVTGLATGDDAWMRLSFAVFETGQDQPEPGAPSSADADADAGGGS